jgi:two-component system phosphate regulon response regulator PhoB
MEIKMYKQLAFRDPDGAAERPPRSDRSQNGGAHFEPTEAPGLIGLDRRLIELGRPGSAKETVRSADSRAFVEKPLVLMAGEMGFISLLKYVIENNGFDCVLTDDPVRAIELAEIERPDLIVLDNFQSRESAWVECQRVYEKFTIRHIPVLILASESVDPHDPSMQFVGKADYLRKPFLPDTFLDWLRDRLRQSSSVVSSNVLRFADIIMDLDAHRVYRNRRCLHLGPVEYGVLQELLNHPRKVLSRNKILATVQRHTDRVAERSVDVHISRIRKELCAHGEPNYIRTVRGVGYSLDAAPDGPATYAIRPKHFRAVV